MKQDIEDLLQLFRDKLGMALGSNLEQVILYGSQARGDEGPDSDLDVPVVVRDSDSSEREMIHRIACQIMWDREFQPLISLNIIDREQQDVDLWKSGQAADQEYAKIKPLQKST